MKQLKSQLTPFQIPGCMTLKYGKVQGVNMYTYMYTFRI